MNLFFDSNLEGDGGSPNLKKMSTSRILQLTEKYNLVDICRIRNPAIYRFTFRQNHSFGFIQGRFDYILVSNILQESIQKTNILSWFCSNHSPILFIYKSCMSFNLAKN